MFGSKVKIDKGLLEKATRFAGIAGYSHVEALITHAQEKEIAKLEGADSEEEIKKRLKGLGYISPDLTYSEYRQVQATRVGVRVSCACVSPNVNTILQFFDILFSDRK